MRHKRYKIGVLMHDKGIRNRTLHLTSLLDCELIFRYTTAQTANEISSEMEQMDQVDAIVAYSKLATLARRVVSIPVITIPLSSYDLARSIHRAMRKGSKIAFIDMATNDVVTDRRDYLEIAAMVGCHDIRRYVCQDNTEFDFILEKALAEGSEVVIAGTTYSETRARERRVPFELLEVGTSSISFALKEALYIVSNQESAKWQNKWLESMMEAFPYPLLSVVYQGQEAPVIGSLNRAAMQELAIRREEAINQPTSLFQHRYPAFQKIFTIQSGCPEEYKLAGESYIVRCDDIVDSAKHTIGALYQFQPADDIKRSELQLRRDALEVGFSAKTTFEDIIGESPAIRNTIDEAIRFSAVSSNILLYGESGSGKEMFAQSIHNASDYSNGPFLALNCATLPENLLEAELFGYEAGTFTGASKNGKAGVLELAHHGTLFLDEVAEMPPTLQAKLLRVLQERNFRRLGGSKNILIDVRIISATHKDLANEVEQGRFRADLMYRLNTLELHIPALRERPEDIPRLSKYFAKQISTRFHKPFYLTPACLEQICAYHWPGNIRELMNFIEQLVVLSSDGTVTVELVQNLLSRKPHNHRADVSPASARPEPVIDGEELAVPIGSLDEMERSILTQCYARFGGNRKEMEQALQISHTTLWRRLKSYGLSETPE